MPRSRSTSDCGARTSPPAAPMPRCSAQQGILSAEDAAAIDDGLAADRGGDRGRASSTRIRRSKTSTCMSSIGWRELIGDAAGRLHTARSRNDQVATDFKLFVRRSIDEAIVGIDALEGVLLDRAEEHAATSCPASPISQSGQPVTLGHHLMAYREMLVRDRSRFADARGADERMPARAARRWPGPASRSTATRPRRRSASTGRPPTASMRSATAISSSIISTPRRSARSICRGWPRRSSCGRRSRSAS